MKRIISVMLSLCLILCSCGKSNEPMVKRGLIDQTKHEDPPKDADETKERKKVIPIKLFDASNKELDDIEIIVKDEEEATMNIDSLKEAIPVDTCNIIEALFFTQSGRGYVLTEEPVYVQHIQAMELTCNVSISCGCDGSDKPTPSPTLKPSVTPNPPTPSANKSPTLTSSPSASLIPEPPKRSEKKDKYAYLKTVCVIVVLVVPILIAYIVNRCRGGRTVTVANADGKGKKKMIVVPQGQQNQEEAQEVEVLHDQEVEQADQEEEQEADQKLDQSIDLEDQSENREGGDIEDVLDATGVSAREVPSRLSSPEPAPEIDPDIARLEFLFGGAMIDILRNSEEVSGSVIRISRQGKFDQLSERVRNKIYSFYQAIFRYPTYLPEEIFKLVVQATSAAGWLDDFGDQARAECSRRGLDFDAILAEQQS